MPYHSLIYRDGERSVHGVDGMAYEKNERKGGSKRFEHKGGDRPYGKEGQGDRRPREGGKDFRKGPRKDFGRKPREDSGERRKSFGDRRPREGGKDYDKRPRRESERRPRQGFGDRPRRDFSDRKRDSAGRSDFHKEGAAPREEPQEPRRLLLPQDASRLLYRGIDCLEKGDTDLAMVMFLHGSVMMSEGCENNADRILKDTGKKHFTELRSRIGPQCSEDALTEFDYLCIRRDADYDRTFFENEYSKGNTHAIYRRICLEEVEGDDPIIDEFAARYPDEDKKVMKGLELLKRKKDSESAAAHLQRIEDAIKLKQSVYVMFTRAMNGDARAVRELKENSKKVPEAAFFSEFLAAKTEGREVEWLRAKYPQYKDLIISRQGEFKIQDDPFGMFLKAKNLEMKKEEYMSIMMNAARAGCPEAMDELSNKMFRNDVRKCLAGIYLKNGDLTNLIIVYQAGLDDMYYLDQYCGGDPDRILEVGRELGKQSVAKEIDWLKDHYDKGMEFCRQALVDKSTDDFYRSKKMIYALHDVGADREAAELYFEMEGDPEVPSVKWLKKVCGDDDVKEYVRKHYEDKGDLATFDSIFEDDGYERRPKKMSGGPRGSFAKGKGGRPSGRRDGRRRLN